MKNGIPIKLLIVILVGLFSFAGAFFFYVGDVRVVPKKEVQPIVTMKDKISQNPFIHKTPRVLIKSLKNSEVETEKVLYFNVFPKTLRWVAFNSIAFCLGVSIGFYLVFLIMKLGRNFLVKLVFLDYLKICSSFALLAIITFFFLSRVTNNPTSLFLGGAEIMEYFGIVFHRPREVIKLTVFAFGVIWLVPLIGMITTNLSNEQLLRTNSSDKKNNLKNYVILRDSLNAFSLFLGLLVGAAILATKLQRSMISEHLTGNLINIYPDELIYTYGVIFSVLLGLFFLPSLFYLKSTRKVLEIDKPQNKKIVGGWEIGKETLDDAKMILSIILPLLTSIIQGLIT
ncbi:hypothetical protein [uncultured Allomuricauda sp.]|uniref:hypothetical protein n=1 Tax=Flagellimonas sp. W118 TaxID=3410791 RepID=UPI0026091B34|nr:hypothetical protein [uncultured Allomuricauda sp.]